MRRSVRPPRQRMRVAVLLGCALCLTACARQAQLQYPSHDSDEAIELSSFLENLPSGARIRIISAKGDSIEAVYKGCEGDSLLVHEMYWKKELVGRSLKKSDESTRIPVTRSDRYYVYRYSTLQKLGLVAVSASGVSAILIMATTTPSGS